MRNPSTRTGPASALTVYFHFLELRHKVELHNLTDSVVECPLDEINRPRASVDPQLRIPPTVDEVEQLFAGWRAELATCRKFAPTARNYAVARLVADLGLAYQRSPDAGSGRRAVGVGPVRETECPSRQGISPQGPQTAAGSADQRRRPQSALVYRGRAWACSTSIRPDTRRRCSRPSARTSMAPACARLRTCSAEPWPRPSTGICPVWSGKLTPHVLRHFCASPALPVRDEPVRDPGVASGTPGRPRLLGISTSTPPMSRTPG